MRRPNAWRQVRWLIAAVCLSSAAQAGQTPAIPANDLVRATVQNELKASDSPSTHHMFASLKQTSNGSQAKLYCETREAIAGMAIGCCPCSRGRMRSSAPCAFRAPILKS